MLRHALCRKHKSALRGGLFAVSVRLVWLAIGCLWIAPRSAADDFVAYVRQHCVACHDESLAEAGLRLDQLLQSYEQEGLSPAPSDAGNVLIWSLVHRRIERGEMPPAEADTPPAAETRMALSALSETLTAVDRQRQQESGRRELRRLSRTEYANTLKDLLDLPHLEIEQMLPPDGRADGFQKSAAALDFSHVMISRYLEAADFALRKALLRHPHRPQSTTIRAELSSVKGTQNTLQTLYVQLKQGVAIPLVGQQIDPTFQRIKGDFKKRDPGRIIDPAPKFDGVATFMNSRFNHNVTVKPFVVPRDGYYKIRVHGWALRNEYGTIKPSDRTQTVAFYSPTGRLLGRCDLAGTPTTGEITAWLNAAERVEYLAISTEYERFNFPFREDPKYAGFASDGIGLQWLEMEGPLPEPDQKWPPERHRRLLGTMKRRATSARPGEWPNELSNERPNDLHYTIETDNPEVDAKRLLRRFAVRALRRPIRGSDLVVPMQQVRRRLQQNQSFVESLLAGYRAILVSPDFLLLQESPGDLDSWAMASRLSCFLINAGPDPSLREAAVDNQLLDANSLRRHTDRLLDSPNSARFVNHFLDDWLDLRNISLTEPDDNLYPEHNELLTESMLEETRAWFAETIRHDLPAGSIIDSDFLMLNQRLAENYGIEGVSGSHIRRVSIPADSVRGGLLTQGSLLKITANGTTTSPVVRGTFVLSRLLGDPPPPPPPSVPAIEPDISGATTVREQLAAHRSLEACASCHQKIDPPGFALESFDVMGAWRDDYRALAKVDRGVPGRLNGRPIWYRQGLPVESAGQLPDGRTFAGIREFRELLRSRESQIARHLLEQLIIFATGEPVGFADQACVDEMMQSLAAKGYGIRSMIHAVVQSELFRRK